jgi:hypothetical protein
MNIIEIGLSHRQRIAETCFSGYVEVTDKDDELVIGITFEEPFEGDGTLFIDILTDADDGFYTADTIKRIGPLNSQNILSGSSICAKNFTSAIDRYICLFYIVSEGTFTTGKITSRVSSIANPWFITSSTEV